MSHLCLIVFTIAGTMFPTFSECADKQCAMNKPEWMLIQTDGFKLKRISNEVYCVANKKGKSK